MKREMKPVSCVTRCMSLAPEVDLGCSACSRRRCPSWRRRCPLCLRICTPASVTYWTSLTPWATIGRHWPVQGTHTHTHTRTHAHTLTHTEFDTLECHTHTHTHTNTLARAYKHMYTRVHIHQKMLETLHKA